MKYVILTQTRFLLFYFDSIIRFFTVFCLNEADFGFQNTEIHSLNFQVLQRIGECIRWRVLEQIEDVRFIEGLGRRVKVRGKGGE